MPRVEEVVQRVRRCLSDAGGVDAVGGVGEVAREYSRAVNEVNDRLQRCVSLVRQGLLSEAVHLAEQPPAVLEEAAGLEFPELDQWLTLCEQTGVGSVPRVDAEAVAELNEAYPKLQEVERLLRAHRRLALGRGPLKSRIKVLRHLSYNDPENPVWSEDLTAFEKERHKQLEREGDRAAQRNDREAIEALDEECNGSIWLEKPPRTLREKISGLAERARKQTSQERQEQLQPEIRDAHHAGELERAESLLTEWDQTAEGSEDPEAVAAARRWVRQEREEQETAKAFRATCDRLERSLDEDRPVEELERIWSTLMRYEREVPRTLRRRYEARTEEKRLTSARKHRLVLVGSVGLLLIVAGTVGAAIYWGMQAERIGDWRQRIAQRIDNENWSEAKKLLARMKESVPDLWSRPAIQDQLARVENGLEEERQRAERFDAAIAQIKAGSLADPDQQALNKADRLASTSAEQTELTQLRSKIQKAQLKAQKERDEVFRQTLGQVRNRFKELRKQANQEGTVPLDELRDLEQRASKLSTREGVSAPLRSTMSSLSDSIATFAESYESRLDRRKAMRAALAELPSFASEPEKLAEKLKQFVQKYPEHELASDFQKAVRQKVGWLAVVRWRDAFNRHEWGRVTDLGEAERRLRTLTGESASDVGSSSESEKGLLQKHSGGPYASALREYRDYLERAKKALANDPSNQNSKLGRLLHHELVKDVWMIKSKAGDRYYVPAQDARRSLGQQITFDYFKNADQAFGREEVDNSGTVSPTKFVDDAEPVRSPQAAFSKKARRLVEQGDERWETRHRRLAALLMEQEGIDPILQLKLLKQFATLARQRDWPNSATVADWLDRADAAELDVNWLDPKNGQAEQARSEAKQILEAAPDFDAITETVKEEWRSLERRLQPHRPVGILMPGGSGEAEVRDDGGAVHVAAPYAFRREESGRWRLKQLKSLNSENAGDEPPVPYGSIIYTRRSAP